MNALTSTIRDLLDKGNSVTQIAILTGAKKAEILEVRDAKVEELPHKERVEDMTKEAALNVLKGVIVGSRRLAEVAATCKDKHVSQLVNRSVRAYKDLSSDGIQRIEVKHSGDVAIGWEAFVETLAIEPPKSGTVIDVTPEKVED